MPSIETYLLKVQRDASLMLGWSGESFQAMKRAIKADPDIRQEAQRVVGGTSQAVANRDHITRWRLDALQRALED